MTRTYAPERLVVVVAVVVAVRERSGVGRALGRPVVVLTERLGVFHRDASLVVISGFCMRVG